MQQDFAATSSLLLRLRVIHPLIAVTAAAYLIWIAALLLGTPAARAATAVIIVVVVQLMAGMLNLALLAPLPMQLTHLLIADLVWIAVVLLMLESIRCKDAVQGFTTAHEHAARASRYAE
jgi:heme A synthase